MQELLENFLKTHCEIAQNGPEKLSTNPAKNPLAPNFICYRTPVLVFYSRFIDATHNPIKNTRPPSAKDVVTNTLLHPNIYLQGLDGVTDTLPPNPSPQAFIDYDFLGVKLTSPKDTKTRSTTRRILPRY